MSGLHLSVSPVEEFVFVDSPITLTVKLHEEDAEIDSTEFQLRLLATFADEYSEDESQCGEFHADFIEIISCGTIDSGAAGTNVIFKVNKVSANYEGKKFIVIVEAFQLQGVSNVYTVASNPFFSVKHKLIITEENAAPYSWYKDEGGKDKCIELLVSLVDANQQLVVNRSVPIRVVLVYQGGQPVEHQEILQISPDSASTIKAGIGRIRVRINEVSTRHRGQLFQVLITPDVLRHPALGDIAHIHCTPVEVKSKRNTIRKVTGDVRNIELAYPMKRQRLADSNQLASSIDNSSSEEEQQQDFRDAAFRISSHLGQWVARVVDRLSSVEWIPIGREMIESNGEGRTLYDIKNPNHIISLIKTEYNQYVKLELNQLQNMLQFGGVGPTALPTLQNDRLQNSSELPVSLPLPGCTSSAYSSADLNGFVYPQGNACPDRRIGGTIDEHHDEAVKSLTDLARSELRNSTERPNASHDKIFTVTSVNNIPFDSVNVILGIPIVSRENYLGIAAFSMSNKSALKLVGFFRDLSGENSSSITSVEFRSVNNAELGYIIEQDKNVLEHITKSLNKAVSQNSPTLFLLNNDRFHGNLDTMIQEAVACSNAYQRKN